MGVREKGTRWHQEVESIGKRMLPEAEYGNLPYNLAIGDPKGSRASYLEVGTTLIAVG